MSKNILVFDAGKTNKKLLLFNDALEVVAIRKARFDEYVRDGVHYEAITDTVQWFFATLKELAAAYSIAAVTITTHGATIACIDEDGNLAVPLVAYTTEPGEEFHKSFYAEMGDPVKLQQQTATPVFGNLISPAKTIFYLKQHYAKEFEKVKYVLHFPQYFGYLLTGKAVAEPTYIGCHSYLWDFHNAQWSVVAARLKLFEKLPPVVASPWHVLGRIKPEIAVQTGLDTHTIVTAGIHDSNASLLPYLIKVKEDFILNSTGTWCVAMRPAAEVTFKDDELGKSVFYNLSAYNQPVKTAIFMGGLEFDTYTSILRTIHSDLPYPGFNPELAAKIITEQALFILPSVVQGTGQFPKAQPVIIDHDRIYPLAEVQCAAVVPDFFRNYETALCVLNLSLALQTRVALERTGAGQCARIFIEGGFRQNDSYNHLVGALFPGSRLYLTDLEEATSFGAALVGMAAIEQCDPGALTDRFTLNTRLVPELKIPGLAEYGRSYLSRLVL